MKHNELAEALTTCGWVHVLTELNGLFDHQQPAGQSIFKKQDTLLEVWHTLSDGIVTRIIPRKEGRRWTNTQM
jgi:hypothetical protein